MVEWHEGAGGIGVTTHDIWFDPFEMRLWGLASCCDACDCGARPELC